MSRDWTAPSSAAGSDKPLALDLKRSVVSSAFRQAQRTLTEGADVDTRMARLEGLFLTAMACVKAGVCEATVPLVVVEDALDVEPVRSCEAVWTVLERQRDVLMQVREHKAR